MTGPISRMILCLCLSVALVVPQVSGALAGLGLADGRLIVICTGDGLRTIRINEAGEPVEVSPQAEMCALVSAVDTAVSVIVAEPVPQVFARIGQPQLATIWPATPAYLNALSRAPPVA